MYNIGYFVNQAGVMQVVEPMIGPWQLDLRDFFGLKISRLRIETRIDRPS